MEASRRTFLKQGATALIGSLAFQYPAGASVPALPKNKGIVDMYDFIIRHKDYLKKKDKLVIKRKENLIKQINELVNNKLENKFWTSERKKMLDNKLSKISEREVTPYDFVDELFNEK